MTIYESVYQTVDGGRGACDNYFMNNANDALAALVAGRESQTRLTRPDGSTVDQWFGFTCLNSRGAGTKRHKATISRDTHGGIARFFVRAGCMNRLGSVVRDVQPAAAAPTTCVVCGALEAA